jgi:O-antigen/teichoic acid export membrane protein
LLLLISLSLSVPTTFRTAFLQGRRDFFHAAFTGVIAASGKIIFSAALVIAGWHVIGAVFGTVIAQITTLLVLVSIVKRRGWLRPHDFRQVSLPDLRLLRPELRFAALVLLTTLSFNVLLSLDILAVKHYFPPTIAGLYGGIETLSRIVFFINISVAGVLLPTVTPHLKSQDRRRLLGQSALLTIGLGAAVLLSFLIAPRLIVIVLMGPKFLPFVHLLPRLGLFTFLASIINLLISYYLAQRRPLIAPAVILGLGTTLGIVALHHATPDAVVSSLIAGGLGTLAWIFVARWLSRRWRPLRSL